MEKYENGVLYQNGNIVNVSSENIEEAKKKTISYRILQSHNSSETENDLRLKFDSLASHDITYVGIIQTARASGLKKFPVPYVLTNCHNSLCAVGGTINADDHRFALSAAHKYGGIYVPANMAVIHSYNREMMCGCGKMILGSDSHTRYGALGTMGVGEGGGELVKQLLEKPYQMKMPEVVLVHVTGKVRNGVGPHDVALALIRETYESGFVKNCVMEFAGEGIHALSQDYRNAIDVMTTETTCWSSIWETDETTRAYYKKHGREADYQKLHVEDGAYYDRAVELDLSEVHSMIALPMHPKYAFEIHEFLKDAKKYLLEAEERICKQTDGNCDIDFASKVDENGNVHLEQGIIAGCSGGTYGNVVAANRILKQGDAGNGVFRLAVYPDSIQVYQGLVKNGTVSDLLESGAIFREAFCGPCFGAGETPANGELSARHTTRNFPNREGSKPKEGQFAGVCLMDARSIAATAVHQGTLTAGEDVSFVVEENDEAPFDAKLYEKHVYNGFGKAEEDTPLFFGPNIKDWPEQPELKKNLLVKIVSHIDDDVTTTDELIPSGETSSYRSNPLRLAEFTLSRRDPGYVGRAKKVANLDGTSEELQKVVSVFEKNGISIPLSDTNVASAIYARMPGDGSAREQAASCQRVLGGAANFAKAYATKRYRSNCINWGMIPFLTEDENVLELGSWVYIERIRDAIDREESVTLHVLKNDEVMTAKATVGKLEEEEKQILKDGCLINYYRNK